MSYKFKDYYLENNHSTNIYIALIKTANARLRLYKKLDELGEEIHYDTDSIVHFDDIQSRLVICLENGQLSSNRMNIYKVVGMNRS